MTRWVLAALVAAAACRPAPSSAPEGPTGEASASVSSPSPHPASAPGAAPASLPTSAPRAATPLPAAASGAPLGENRSGVDYVGACGGTRPCQCRAADLFHGRNALERLGIDETSRREGTACLLADLDGNGHTDAVFLGEPKAGLRSAVALLFDGVGLSAVLELPKPVRSLALSAGIPGRASLADGDIVFLVREGKIVMGKKAP